ncbi:MAG: LacI family transcriptional regulator [bacterium]|nr:LacI family transcriptional regulator [bacterium]
MKPKTTLKDIAKKLNISVSSVSLALNNKPGISDSLRKEIYKTCLELGYNLDRFNQNEGFGGNVGLLLREEFLVSGEAFYTRMVHAAQEEAERRNYHVILNSVSQQEISDFEKPHFFQNDIKGILIAGYMPPDYVRFLLRQQVPIVLMGYDIVNLRLDSIECENFIGAYTAVNYLIEKGHRTIGLIGGVPEHYSPLLRMAGYRMALAQAQLPLIPEIIVDDLPQSNIILGLEATLDILKRYKGKIDAFFCVTDNYATGCMKAIREAGYRVPEEISVVGFDNMDWVAHLTPGLTTMNIPTLQMGLAGMQRLLELIEAKVNQQENVPRKILFPVELVVRESVAEVKSAIEVQNGVSA